MSNYQSIKFYPEACHGFVSQLYAGSESPSIKDSPTDNPVVSEEWTEAHLGQLQYRGSDSVLKSPSPGNLVLTLLEIKKVNRHYGKSQNAIPVYDLVCMDGDQGVVKCRLNSGLSGYLVEDQPVPGSTVVIESFVVMHMIFELFHQLLFHRFLF